MKNELHLMLPEEIERDFSLEEILLVKKTAILCSLKKKVPFSEAAWILKIIPKREYNKVVYEKLSLLSKGGILTAVQEYHTKHFIYFIFPKLQSLSYLVKAGKMDFHNIKGLMTDIGATLLSLHKESVFHMDIAPGNIYQNDDGHFVLGDFSSARIVTDQKNCRFFPVYGRPATGSTKGFYPENISPDMSPANYDLYGFFMILFLLLNHGDSPFWKKQTGLRKEDTFEQNEHTPSTKFDFLKSEESKGPEGKKLIEKINRFLRNTLLECNTEFLPPPVFERRFSELMEIFSEVKEQKILDSFQSEISDYENSFFCSFTEPEERKFPAFPFFTTQANHFSFEKKIKYHSIPKSLFSKEILNKSALYGLLMVCGFLFLFACYHNISNTGKQSKSRTQIETKHAGTIPSPSIEKHPPSEADELETSGFSNTILPEKSEPPGSPGTSPQEPDNTELPVKTSLDLAGKSLQNTSFLSETWKPGDITIIFAQNNKFSGVRSFLSFTNVRELYLSQNPITSIQGIQKLKHLEVLDLSGNRLEEISPLCSLANLRIIDLCGQTHIKDIRMLKNLKTLEYLILTNSNVKEGEISALKKQMPACSILY
ncbi:MAG: leucine-rich repeat domain-containing protein [Lachnospiraceae bacterium]|nr:leucine-rich repeat domain-containing protein [Lachnospiraceae bacterium]